MRSECYDHQEPRAVTLTPSFVVIPGTEGMASYKDYMHHLRGFLIGTLLSTALGLLMAAVVFFL